jgi:hypothetical protein
MGKWRYTDHINLARALARRPYPMPAGTREPVTIAGRPWERVWRADGTYECVPVDDGRD